MKRINNIKAYSFRKFLSVFIAALLLNACNDKLDLFPEDSISDASFWKSAKDFEIAANNFYLTLKGYSNRQYDADCDILAVSNAFNPISDGSYIPPEVSSIWDDSYEDIRGFNYLIEKAEGYEGDRSEILKYVAEAKFFRAYVYFRLFKDYGGIPLILKPLDISSEELYQKRASRKEVVNQVVSDLDDAISVLPNESEIGDKDKGRISKQAAEAFKARVTLYEGTWQKFRNNASEASALLQQAVNASESVINSQEFELFKALGDSSYKYLFLIDNNAVAKSNPLGLNKSDIKEFVLMKKYSFALNIFGGHSHGLQQTNSPTKKMADMYLCNDGLPIEKSLLFQGREMMTSEFENRDLRMKNSFVVPGTRYFNYGALGRDFDNPDNPGEGNGILKPSFGENTCTGYVLQKTVTEKMGITINKEEADYPVIRYAEVLLIYAEAKYELEGSISDADLNKSLNVVRERVNMPPLTNAFIGANGLNMREEIRRERTVELFMEDFRLDDLKRWKTAEVEMPMSLRGILFTGTEYESYQDFDQIDSEGYTIWQSAEKRKFEEKHYLFPLPTVQINIMGMEQNPGW